MTDRTKNRIRKYSGKVVNLDIEEVVLPNGHHCELEIIDHPGGAAVVAINENNQVCLLHQYRHVAGDRLWELPAGKIEQSEPPANTARRELAEEAGLIAEDWQELGSVYTSPGVFREVIHLYLARNLKSTKLAHEPEEVIEIKWFDLIEALNMAQKGQIIDAKSLIGLYRVMSLLDPDQ